jgi:hypothetical protein
MEVSLISKMPFRGVEAQRFFDAQRSISIGIDCRLPVIALASWRQDR